MFARLFLGIVIVWLPVSGVGLASGDEPRRPSETDSEHRLIFVTLDGLRWQEVFHGADFRLATPDAGGVRDIGDLTKRFLDEDQAERRKRLMPFICEVMERQGQVWGNVDRESIGRCTNGRYFSYPGYSELIVGFADPAIDSNEKKNNSNLSVLEWLHQQPAYAGQISMFGSWDVFPFILNQERSGIRVNAGWQSLAGDDEVSRRLNTLADELPRYWPGVRYDYFTIQAALNELTLRQPKVLWVALGETDDWAHEGRYDLYLDAAYRNDRYVRELWEACQSLEGYRDHTTLIVTVDHGRGDGPEGWKSHGANLAGSEFIWLAAMGPGIPALGARKNNAFTQSQIAATLAKALGQDFPATNKNVAPPILWEATNDSSK